MELREDPSVAVLSRDIPKSEIAMLSTVRSKAIVAGAVLIGILLLMEILFVSLRQSPPGITVRHVKSTQSESVTTMSFEVTNHTADPYTFDLFQVQVRTGNAWTNFQDAYIGCEILPLSVAFYTVEVTNLTAGSTVRLSFYPQKILSGFNGFFRRAELRLTQPAMRIPLNPNDKLSGVVGPPTEVVSEEWVEAGSK